MKAEHELQSYFDEAASWDADRAALARKQMRFAWIVAAGGWTCAVAVAIALMLLMPLKRVDPFVIRVDSATGLVDVVPVFTGQTEMPEAVTRYFLDHYVTVCERFNYATAESDYEECGAFHTPARNQAWYSTWSKSNPTSPLNVYKDGTTLRVQVTSISFFTRANGGSDLAQVRYVKAKRPSGGGEEQRTHWIATIQYTYAEPSKDTRTRRWNPLGFKIVDFRPEAEVLTPPTDGSSAPLEAAASMPREHSL